MLSQHTTIIGLNRCDGIFPMSDGGMKVKISGTSIPFFYPIYFSSLFPISSLLFKERNELGAYDISEVLFQKRKISKAFYGI